MGRRTHRRLPAGQTVKASKASVTADMRFTAALISTQMLVSAVSAEELPEKLVSIVREVCVAATSPEAMMAAGEKAAAEGNWKLVRSGPTPAPLMHNVNGPKVSFTSGWQFGLPDGSQATLYISILRPEQPGLKYDICLLQPTADVDGDDLTRAIEIQFGSMLQKSARFKNDQRWFFTEERIKGNCGKQISFFLNQSQDRGKSKTLLFTDFADNDRQWPASSCPN
jgi:hypothetical protein